MNTLEDIKARLCAGVPSCTILIHAQPRQQPDYRTGFEQRGEDIACLLREVATLERLLFGASSIICKFEQYENIKGDHAKQVEIWIDDLRAWLPSSLAPDSVGEQGDV